MAQHKAPTQVTVVVEEKSGFAQFVDRYWKLAAGGAVVLIAAVLGKQASDAAAEQARLDVWVNAQAAAELSPAGVLLGEADSSATGLGSPAAEAMVTVAKIQALVQERQYDDALAEVQALRETGYEPGMGLQYGFEDGSESDLANRLDSLIHAQRAWENANPGLFENPALPEGSPRVRITTSAGDLVVGLYQEAAPNHVENFLKHIASGYYVGTKFHRIIPGFMVQGGDPNTKEGEVSTWGQGGPGFKVDREVNELSHFKHVLAAAKMGSETQSSGSQFYITAGAAHHLDGQHVVYGVLLEGAEILEDIENGEIDPEDQQGTRPLAPVSIDSTSLIE